MSELDVVVGMEEPRYWVALGACVAGAAALFWWTGRDCGKGKATLQAALSGRIAMEQGQDAITATLTALEVGRYVSRNHGHATWDEEPWASLVVA